VTIRGAGGRSFSIPFEREAGFPSDLLVIPRRVLDNVLVEHAKEQGATFFSGVKVESVRELGHGRTEILAAEGPVLQCRLAVFASGAESQLLRAVGLLSSKPLLEHAARAYFENVDGLDQNVTLFFDGVDMPGYGWIFPTGARSANIGCGVFDQRGTQQAKRLAHLVAEHPLLVSMLKNARQVEPIRAYPLRTDFRPAYAGVGARVCVGEAAGLVNPITGEGIDYAFESAEFLAQAAKLHWNSTSGVPHALVENYRARLRRRFALRFRFYRWVQHRCLSGADSADFLGLIEHSPALRRALVDGLFGRSRLSTYLNPPVLGAGLRMALFARHPSEQGLPPTP
jgi:flavin-dependent dehydrogenase